ncbi:MAG: hypothetical protein GFH27_549287n50 [Chloroflexi bacterium AL-W]|nr:hypothetical protein [Chloroflexi bacterium AL-N1]NOK66324.1 hypothetical protein [Chloroflexi bacterium AL-N10]NOK71712.1 hypothetical protein [Chloroflexi bacterium AL-N5]NOK80969.1 hypothetical protein [Chloroflexi bacterium AL-W]NOK89242.1 hypothetical protein [Chloroflexi bacterium AL-N15]
MQQEVTITDNQALTMLLEGNERYATMHTTHPDQTLERRSEVVGGQHPFAIIFGCVDSRVPPEIVFDQGLGNLLVIRTAGHVIGDVALGSIEFGVEELGIPLVVVLGHEQCGAVAAAITAVEHHVAAHDKIQTLVDHIRPAVEQAQGQTGDLLHNAVWANIELAVNELREIPLLQEFIEKGKLTVVGACYELDTGKVILLEA